MRYSREEWRDLLLAGVRLRRAPEEQVNLPDPADFRSTSYIAATLSLAPLTIWIYCYLALS